MNTEDDEFVRIEREIKMRGVPDAMTTADLQSPEYTQGWNDCRYAMLAEQPAQRKPLTEEEITAIDDEIMKSPRGYCIKFARAIEAAHGIKENT